MHLYTLKHQLTLTFKTLKKLLKNLLVTLPLHVSAHSFDHPQSLVTCTINERKSAEPNLVTAQSTAYEPPENGRMSGPKRVGVTSLKGFLTFF